MAFDDLKNVCASVAILYYTGIVEAVRAALSWVRRASKYHSLVQPKHDIKDALPTTLEEN